MKHFQYSLEQGVVTIEFNLQGSSSNVLNAEVMDEFECLLDELQDLPDIQGGIFISMKASHFIVGADIQMLSDVHTLEQGAALSQRGQAIFQRIESLRWPLVAAVHGNCLGGGFELVLACRGCVCSDDESTVFAVPEVQLGLLPGAGGTQRLLQRLGLLSAAPYLLTGKKIRSRQAKKLGLVQDCVPQANLHLAAQKVLRQLNDAPRKRTVVWYTALLEWMLKHQAGLRKYVINQLRRRSQRQSKGLYPALPEILNVVETYYRDGVAAGFNAEANAFARLLLTPQSRALRHLFQLTVQNKSLYKDALSEASFNAVQSVAVLGAGLMGSGIAYVSTVKAKALTRVKDVSLSSALQAYRYSWRLLQSAVRRKQLHYEDAKQAMTRLSICDHWRGLAQADLFIEAIFEQLSIKQETFTQIEQVAKADAIFASNTSSIPIRQIASVCKHPERVIGLHYFSPVERMPLVEIVVTPETSEQTLLRCVEFVRRQGKYFVVVQDAPGFYTSRILAPYLNEAALLLQEGAAIEQIDQALEVIGFPIGPLALLDEVGLDVAGKIVPVLQQAYPDRMMAAEALDTLLQQQRYGKKSQKGFYVYRSGASKKSRQSDKSVYAILGVTASAVTVEDIQQRCLLQMLIEAIYCLEEQVIQSVEAGDLAAVMGLGFPPCLGGPFYYADQLGGSNLLAQLDQMQQRYGDRFKAPALLRKMVDEGLSFYPATVS